MNGDKVFRVSSYFSTPSAPWLGIEVHKINLTDVNNCSPVITCYRIRLACVLLVIKGEPKDIWSGQNVIPQSEGLRNNLRTRCSKTSHLSATHPLSFLDVNHTVYRLELLFLM